jgi:hypothetical protein
MFNRTRRTREAVTPLDHHAVAPAVSLFSGFPGDRLHRIL